jgi:hypothetical protein
MEELKDLTENITQQLKCMVSVPEIARLINEFQDDIDKEKCRELEFQDNRHREQIRSNQENFKKQVKKLCEIIEEMGNPFPSPPTVTPMTSGASS